jgi:hypothetical protein
VRGTARVGSDLQVAGRVVGSDLKALFAAARHRAGLLVDGPHADGSLGDLVGLDDGVVPPGRFSRSARNPNTSAVGLRIITVFSKVAQPLLSDAERLSAFTGLPASSDTPSPLAELLSSLSAGATAGTSEPTLPTRCAGRCSPGLCQAVELGGCPRVVPPCPRSFRSVVVRPVSNLVSIRVPVRRSRTPPALRSSSATRDRSAGRARQGRYKRRAEQWSPCRSGRRSQRRRRCA